MPGGATPAHVIEAHPDERLQREPYRRIVHTTHVRYRYSQGGRTFESRRLSYQPTDLLGFTQANALLDGPAMNRETIAYVNPRDPAQAVLVQGASFGNLVRLVAAILAIGAVLSLPT